jgi:diacylglycerol O-acyltransferase / wax synthase
MADHLTPLDAAFLELEEGDESSHMHVGWAMIFEPLPEGGTPSLTRVRKVLGERLAVLPRFHRRLSSPRTGRLSWPEWVEDEDFEIADHVRRARLPPPGEEPELLEWLGDFYSHRLDRSRPLWEMTLLDGLAGERWAVAVKIHHCLVDGISGASIVGVMLDTEADPDPDAKTFLDLLEPFADNETGIGPLSVLTHGARAGLAAVRHPRRQLGEMLDRSRALAELVVRDELRGAPRTSLNRAIGASRRLGAVAVPLEEVKSTKRALGGTVNDIVLAASAGGLRRLFEERGEDLDPRGLRVMVPVSLRETSEMLALGNRVSSLFVELPLAEADPIERYRRTMAAAEALKRGRAAAGAETLTSMANVAPPVLHAVVARLSFTPRLFNVTITNVRGPGTTLYMLGSRLRRVIPLVPIFADHAVGIAVASYDGEIVFGLNADRAGVPDLDVLAGGIADSLAELRGLAAAAGGA